MSNGHPAPLLIGLRDYIPRKPVLFTEQEQQDQAVFLEEKASARRYGKRPKRDPLDALLFDGI